ncbi:UNVERIFIED_CONTAM: Cytochrome c oxidase subunitC [Sesamum angustifolium]|uniref:Cytochrome c oxidase subunitC n=1 Tax=Sesamum angustifolium TaxID=2727405 RepID=A0AAW2NMA8_9LAMI
MAAAHVVYKGPSILKEILIGIGLGLVAGGFWKMHHWNNQKRTKEFYDLLDKGPGDKLCFFLSMKMLCPLKTG